MRAALINSATREVVNVIMADPEKDSAPDGFEIAAIPDECVADVGWLYSSDRGFVMGPSAKAQIRMEAEAAYNHPDAVLIRSIEANPDAFLDAMEVGRG